MTSNAPISTIDRDRGVDTGRLIAAFGVVAVHVEIALSDSNQPGLLVWVVLCRWAVPFFFVASGYYAHRTGSVSATLRYVATRILPLLIVWNLVYFAIQGPPAPGDLWRILITGTRPAYHLWFLPSLAIGLLLLALLRQVMSPPAILLAGILLYLVGLAFSSYSEPLFHQNFRAIWDTRNGPFFGFVFVAAGFLLRQRGAPSAAVGGLLFAAGAALQAIELIALYRIYDISPHIHDFLFGTLAMGVGAFLLFRGVPDVPLTRRLGALGGLAFGLYAVHILLLAPLTPRLMPDPTDLGQAAALLVVTFSFSLGIVWLMAQIPLLRRFLS